MRHLYECPMRWADLDLLGHVNNVTYVDYLQEARVDMLRAHAAPGPDSAGLAEGVVVVRHEVTYLRPLLFTFDAVWIECWVTEIRAASFTLAYEVFRESTSRRGERVVFLRATTVLTPYVFAAERPRRITAAERDRLERYLEPTERAAPRRLPSVARTDVGHYPVHVRFSDVDVYRHVNNVVYFEYFQEARLRYLSRGLWAQVPREVPRANIVVAQTDVDYTRPILLRPEPYDCWSELVRVGRTSVAIHSEIRDAEELLASALVTIVFVDESTGVPAPPPAPYREAMLAALSG